jgi:hypothetical protein
MLHTIDQIKTHIINNHINNENIDKEIKPTKYKDRSNLSYVVNKKLKLSVYNTNQILNINQNESDINTLLYLFNHISAGIYVKIVNNKIELFMPFENKKFNNNWHQNIKFDKEENDEKNISIFNSLMHFIKIRKRIIKRFNRYEYNISKWHCNANIINNEKYDSNDNYTPHSIFDYYDIIKETLLNHIIGDVCFYINKRDSCVLHKNLLEPYPNMYPKNDMNLQPKLDEKYQNKCYAPVLSPYTNENYADIPFIIPEDWKLIYTRSTDEKNTNSIKWEDKIETAVFRGSATGSVEFKNNQRLQIAKIDNEWKTSKPDLIDAGIVSWNARDKIDSNLTITYIKPKEMNNIGIFLKKKIPMNEQVKFKYIINIDGHSATNRFSYLLQSGSLILNVESKYVIGNQRWYDHLLIPYKHYVPIKYDLSDLEEIILWCRLNDDKCKLIVQNALELYNNYFTKEHILKYTANLFNLLSNQRLKDN